MNPSESSNAAWRHDCNLNVRELYDEDVCSDCGTERLPQAKRRYRSVADNAAYLSQFWLRLGLYVRTVFPRIMWTVVERDGRAEFVIWREWLGNAYGINSIAALPGRYDRETNFGRNDG